MNYRSLRTATLAVLMSLCGARVLPAQVSVRPEMLERLSKNRSTIVRGGGAARIDTVSAARPVQLDRRQILAAVDTLASPKRSPADSSRVDLPIYGVAEVGGAAREFHVVVEEGAGLRYDPAARQFRGRIFMGLEDASHGRVIETSFEPLHLQVFGADSVHPPLVSLDHFDVPFAPVVLASGSPADSLYVRIRPKGQPAIRYGVPMLRIPLSMTADSDTVGGFGVDEVTLSLPFPEEFAGDTLEVMLDGDGVSAKPPSLVLHRGASAPAKVTVRSAGLGKRALTARGQPYTKPVRVELYFGPPWSFIISSLLGGAAAAVVRELARKRATGPRTRFLVAGLIGAFCGFLVAALFVNGVNVAGISLSVGSSELVVFAIAALGGLGGVEALARAVPSLGHLLSAPAS